MLPTRDPSQDKRPTQTESEGLETNFSSKQTRKKKQGRQYSYQTKQTSKNGQKGRPLHNTQRKNPPRRHKHCKYICSQYRSTQIHKENLGGLQERLTATQLQQGILIPHCQRWTDILNKISTKILWHQTMPYMKWTKLIYREPVIPKKQNTYSFQMHMEYFQRQTT